MTQPKLMHLNSPDFTDHAHAYFAWMRREAPVYEARLTRSKPVYLVTRYEDVAALLKDERLVKNPDNARTAKGGSANIWMPGSFRLLMHNMLNSDEPDHRRLRNLVHKAFTPRRVAELAPRIEAIAHQLLSDALAQGQVDLVQAFALPLPVTVITEMIGVPPADRAQFRAWSQRILVNPTPLNMLRAIPALRSLLAYMRRLADARRRDPRDDLLTGLAQAEEDGDRLTEDELLGMLFLLLVAGHETTVGLLTNGIYALLSHPEQLARLRAEPDLMETAVEELLRYDGPLQTTELAFARQPFTLHHVAIPQGAIVLPAILSANRDAAAFERPDELDIARQPNRHLAFGGGIHYCLGAPLARLEAKIGLCALLERSPGLRLAVEPGMLHYQNLMIIHRWQTLPVQL